MSKVAIIESFKDFISEIKDLYGVIDKARQARIIEYKNAGKRAPHRIRFEEVDLNAYKERMLRVHKSLQWRRHNFRLEEYEQNSKLVAIAGICELIKEEYVGKFWDLYREYIGYGGTSTVYDWIWEKGFKEEGIELIYSPFSGRREFVQTLVFESGIPRSRYNDLINFFILYWRYFRQNEDIEELINAIADNEIDLKFIPRTDRERLQIICINALDFSRAFAHVAERLLTIFQFIESSEEIFTGNLSEHVEYIYKSCGIDPMEILRDKHQLDTLYNRILGLTTPEKLRRILKSKLPGIKITSPKRESIRVDLYIHNIMYGKHILEDIIFSCVPTLSYTLYDLYHLPFNKIIRNGNDRILKSKSAITATVNGRNRPDLVKHYYAFHPIFNSVFEGYVFHTELQPAMTIEVSTEDGSVSESISELDGFNFSAYLQCLYNPRSNTYYLVVYIPSIRIKSKSLAAENITVISDLKDEPLFEIALDRDGMGNRYEEFVTIKSPSPGIIHFYAARSDSMEPISIEEKDVGKEIELTQAMLFSAFTKKQLNPQPRGSSVRYGGRRFVLLLDKTLKSEEVEIRNLKIADNGKNGNYRVLFLEWEDLSNPCSIVTESAYWKFERCLELNLHLNKKSDKPIECVNLDDKQGINSRDFELILSPIPPSEIEDELYWNIIVNNGNPYRARFKKPPDADRIGKVMRISGNDIAELLERVWNENTGGSATAEIHLCNSEHAFDSVKFWLFPELKIIPPQSTKEGDEVFVNIQVDDTSAIEKVVLKDKRGSPKAKFRLSFSNGVWKKIKREYSGVLEIDWLGTSLDLSVEPSIRGVRFGSRTSGESELPRNLLKKELDKFDLIISGFKEIPKLSVNGESCDFKFSQTGDLIYAPLGQLSASIREETNIVAAEEEDKIIQYFDVVYKLYVEDINIVNYPVDNSVIGSCSFGGPVNSGLEFVVFVKLNNTDLQEIARYPVPCDGESHKDYAVNFKLNPKSIAESLSCIIKLRLISDMRKPDAFHEYGEIWNIKLKENLKEQDYELLKSNAISAHKEGRHFIAKKMLEMALEAAPESEKEWARGLMMNIDFSIMETQINSVSAQIARSLKVAYMIDYSN